MDGERDETRVRRAEAADALTLLASGSSALTGEYGAIIEDMRISADHIRRDHVYVCEAGGEIVGFYARMGATRTGTRAPSGRVTWESPRMWVDLG